MGVDLSGVDPADKKGKDFRNNWWYWRPTWDFVYYVCQDILTESDNRKGHYNDGYLISGQKAEKIAKRLKSILKTKDKYKKTLAYVCEFYNNDMERDAYKSDWKNIKEFAEFCEKSGGFRIY